MKYPETRKDDTRDTYFDTEVADPYRWLEDDLSDETADWVARQNAVTFDYLAGIPYRGAIADRLTELWNYEKQSAPSREGNFDYFYRNDGLQDQFVVYRRDDEGNESVFLDPNTFSEDGTTSLAELTFSRDGSLASYAISEGGSDWRKIIVIDTATLTQVDETLVDAKFTSLSWRGNEGFYYSRYEKPDGSELSAKVDQHLLYFHRVGTRQADDELVFGGTAEEKYRYVFGGVTEDDRYLVIEGAQSTSGNSLFIRDLEAPEAGMVTVLDTIDTDASVIDSLGGEVLVFTNQDAPNGRVVAVDLANPAPDHWREVIPEQGEVLTPSTGAGYVFAHYLVDAVSRLQQFTRDGELVREIELPGPGTALAPSGKHDASVLYYTFTNYHTPAVIFAFDPVAGSSVVYRDSAAKFEADLYVSEQVFFTSRDGTKVPMIITHRSDLELNGSNPAMLYGYGGFNISLTPEFSVPRAVWLEMGGVYAVPALRGGGEYGKAWHLAGTKQQKQNVFDDFIAAAEYLCEAGYTSPQYLSLRGGSNGGLLVGAVMTQRPDLARVALPAVGVLDMLRYHTFTAGAGWAYDYGTAEDDVDMFAYLKGYSPLHNVREGERYPATLVTTADHDDRVVPAHSFKFAATLQEKCPDGNPLMIRIETNAGHGLGTPVSKTIEECADLYAFAFYNMGFNTLPGDE